MKISKLKENDKVIDRWYPEWGIGRVTKVLKTVVYIDFTIRGPEKYDKSHVENFLERKGHHFIRATEEGIRDAAASLR